MKVIVTLEIDDNVDANDTLIKKDLIQEIGSCWTSPEIVDIEIIRKENIT